MSQISMTGTARCSGMTCVRSGMATIADPKPVMPKMATAARQGQAGDQQRVEVDAGCRRPEMCRQELPHRRGPLAAQACAGRDTVGAGTPSIMMFRQAGSAERCASSRAAATWAGSVTWRPKPPNAAVTAAS